MGYGNIGKNISDLKSNEQLDVIIRKKKKDKTPPYSTIGSGFSTKDFKEDVVVDAFKVIGNLSPQQLEIFLYFRDEVVQKQLDEFRTNIANTSPNTIVLSKSTLDYKTKELKRLLRANGNSKKMIELDIIRKVKAGVYMVNPYILIPTKNFSDVASEWNNYS